MDRPEKAAARTPSDAIPFQIFEVKLKIIEAYTLFLFCVYFFYYAFYPLCILSVGLVIYNKFLF